MPESTSAPVHKAPVTSGQMLAEELTPQRPRLYWAALAVLAVGALLLLIGLLREGPTGPWQLVGLVALGGGLSGMVVGQRQVHRALQAHALAMAGAHDGIWEWNPVTKELKVGRRLLAILGYTEDFLLDTHRWMELVHPADRKAYNRAVSHHLKGLTDHFYCEYRVRAHSGQYRWIAARGLALRDRHGVSKLMAGSVSDITEAKNHEAQVRDLAFHDQLTGLPNRRSLTEWFPGILAEASRLGKHIGVLFLDLDRFKNINDTLGHAAGDELLKTLARRLPMGLRAYDVVFRQGGDELIILLPALDSAEEAGQAACRLLEVITSSVRIDGHELRVTASLGLAIYPEDGRDPETLLRNADIAMYEAKSAGGNDVRYFEERMNARLHLRVSLESRLRRAVENGDFSLHYQPVVRCADQSLVAAEALLRWNDCGRPVPPDQFIPIAEETGLIDPLGEWVLNTAIAQAARWHQQGARLRIAINLSIMQILRRDILRGLLDRVERAGLAPSIIELEITESVLLSPEGGGIATLRSLREAGFRLALDDFGTGYSSLSYLTSLQLDSLKIDKSFIAALAVPSLAQDRDGEAIVHAILAMAHQLRLEVVAEGVETPAQHSRLVALGCDLCQGYLFSRPLAAADFASTYLSTGVRSQAL